MFHRLFSKKLIQNAFNRITSNIHHHYVYFVHTQSFKSNSNISISTNYHLPTVSYLVEKCGLSLDSAILVSTKIYRNIKSTARPDSVLELFNTYGLTQKQITKLITKYPNLILADPVKNLKPKLEYFESSLGFSKPDIASIVDSNGIILCVSLRNVVAPIVNLLKNLLLANGKIITVLKKCFRLSPQLALNTASLQHRGVPHCNISKFIMLQPVAYMRKNDQFKEMVREIAEMGFDPYTRSFVHALSVRCSMTKLSWEKKVAVYKSFGWTEEDVISAFRLQPQHMGTSEKKIRKLMDLYLNKFGLRPSNVAKYPNLMLISLEKRIIPRCSVLQVLLLNGLVEKDLNVVSALTVSSTYFENKYVSKYQEIAPEVLKAYKGELGYPRLETMCLMLGCAD